MSQFPIRAPNPVPGVSRAAERRKETRASADWKGARTGSLFR